MHLTIYNAISIDGYIARTSHDTSWVSDTDWEEFQKLVKASKAIVMGRKTYQVSGDDFPYDCELNIVMTGNKTLIAKNKNHQKTWFTNLSPAEIVTEIKNRGYHRLLIIGGGTTNASFLRVDLIDELILSVHPLILGSGIRLFEADNLNIKLKKIAARELDEGLVQVRYQVIK